MLEEFSITNFKAFADEQRIPLKPITLIFGANSCGKSSILQSLVWAKDAFESGEIEFDAVGPSGDKLDLGGIENVFFRKHKERRIRFEFQLPDETIEDYRVIYEIGVWTHDLKKAIFSKPESPDEIKAYADAEAAFLEAEARFDEEITIGRFMKDDDGNTMEDDNGMGLERDDFDEDEIKQMWRPKLQALWETWRKEYNKEGIEEALEQFKREHVDPYWEMLWKQDKGPNLFAFEIRKGEETFIRAERRSFDEELVLTHVDVHLLVNFPFSEFLGVTAPEVHAKWGHLKQFDLSSPVGIALAKELAKSEPSDSGASGPVLTETEVSGTIQFVGLRPITVLCRGVSSQSENEDMLPSDLENALREVIKDCGDRLKNALNSCTFLGPLRTLPPRLLLGFALHERTKGAEEWIGLRDNDELRKKVNQWIGSERLDTGYEFCSELFCSLESALSDISDGGIPAIWTSKNWDLKESDYREGFERSHKTPEDEVPPDDPEEMVDFWSQRIEGTLRDLSLRDSVNRVNVTHRDVGVGISQLIPVVVQALSQSGGLIAVEQPELHLHPALQAKMGDLFIHSSMKENGNRFLLETHSEHMILRILRRIRETSAGELPEGEPLITPSDVCVLYVERSENGSKVIELPVTEDGDFSRPWPKGFFTERVEELF